MEEDSRHGEQVLHRWLPATAVAAWVAAWWALDPSAPALAGVVLVVVAVGVAAVPVVLLCPAPWRTLVVACVVCAVAAALAAALRAESVRSSPVWALAHERAYVHTEGVVTGDPYPLPAGRFDTAARFAVPVRVELVRARGATYRLRTPVQVTTTDATVMELLPSQRVSTGGRLSPSQRSSAGAAFLSTSTVDALADANLVQRWAGTLRAGLRDSVSGLPPDVRGLVPGLVVGDVSTLPTEVIEDFRTAGLTHLTAVSGANCAIVVGFVLLLTRWAGLPRRCDPVVGAAALLWFVVLARPQPSVLRAAAMGLLALAALATGRRRPAMNALAATVLILLFLDPSLARSFGLALSALATAGILVLGPPIVARLTILPRWAAQAVAVPVAAYAACAPVLVLLDPRISLVAVPANLLAAPMVAPATILGMLAATVAPIAPPVAQLFGWLAGLPARALVVIADVAASVPHAAVPWPGGVGGSLAVAAAVAGVVLLVRHGHRRVAVPLTIALVLVTVATLLLPLRPGWPPSLRPSWPPAGWVLVACDVGQGDALVLNTGADSAVVVDTGPDPSAVDACLSRLDVRQVDLLVITHAHADHRNGLGGVVQNRRVGAVGVAGLASSQGAGTAMPFSEKTSTPVMHLRAGEVHRIGGLTLHVLWPRRVLRAGGSDENNASVVLLAEREGLTMLLTGDVEPPAQAALARDPLVRADVLKVPHHGSAYQHEGFLDASAARVALVSAGKGNDYGHPAASTLAALEQRGMRVHRTDQEGDVAVVMSGGRIATVSRGRAWITPARVGSRR